ncbi:ROK family transcriptional regulator [Bifidobacterium amazonense]|uniref:ROK family transcriptional regulator n=1 Tax=Bifidobacterium amazonense TaxID=2809027 RepID=A0ABS9VSW9_9BIFI|nr:ROK family transcriptional regulator [Bifidobacterium amazonense]MCH9275190.1 ROK family transcriptional regulator [Bifidobacterium amazonense]
MHAPSIAPNSRDRSRIAILRYLYRNRQATKQQLAHNLSLSSPTVTQHLRELAGLGIVVAAEPQASTGGRKAVPYAFNPRHRIAVGVCAGATETTLIAVDLYGEIVARLDRTLPRRNDAAYYQRVAGIADEFANGVEQSVRDAAAGRSRGTGTSAAGDATGDDQPGSVTGIAICSRNIMPTDVTGGATKATGPDHDADGTGNADGADDTPDAATRPHLAFADATGTPGFPVQAMRQLMHRPITPMRDADAAAAAELWFDHTLRDAACVYLDRRPCGAIIAGGRVHQNRTFRNGMIEHMSLVPGGRPCYCGQRGCMDVYCSPETLPEDYESLPGFFSVLEQGETHHRERMNEWMDRVAQAIVNIRAVIAGDVIVGGEAAQYLDDDDIADLKSRVAKLSPFGGGDNLRLRRGLCMDGQPALGAALSLIGDWLDDHGCR